MRLGGKGEGVMEVIEGRRRGEGEVVGGWSREVWGGGKAVEGWSRGGWGGIVWDCIKHSVHTF